MKVFPTEQIGDKKRFVHSYKQRVRILCGKDKGAEHTSFVYRTDF